MKKINTAKSKDTKKSQGNIIAVIIIILLCFFTIIILWRVISPMFQNTKEESQIRQELSKTQIGVNDVSGDLSNPAGKIDVTLTRGSEPLEFKKKETKQYINKIIPQIDFVSAIDISSSIYDVAGSGYDYLNCQPKTPIPEVEFVNNTCIKNDCTTPAGCKNASNGIIFGGKCYLKKFNPYCCQANNNCSNQGNCTYCTSFTKANGYPNDGWYLTTATPTTNSYCTITTRLSPLQKNKIGDLCNNNKLTCEVSCNGTYIEKLTDQGIVRTCTAVPGQGCCNTDAGGWDCTTLSGCDKCHSGQLTGGICTLRIFKTECCRLRNDCPTNETNCTDCGGVFTPKYTGTPYSYNYCVFKGRIVSVNTSKTYPYYTYTCDYAITRTDSTAKTNCEKLCEGNYTIVTKLDFVKNAHVSDQGIINKIIPGNNLNRIGIVNYSTGSLILSPLTNDSALLKSNIRNLASKSDNTNICQALNQSIELLNTSLSPAPTKVIILMTDGKLNVFCNGTSIITTPINQQPEANTEAINMAARAKSKGIKVFTIGVGTQGSIASIDEQTLKAIALAGGGNYSYANVTELEKVYQDIIDLVSYETLTFYTSEQLWDTIRFVISNDTSTYVYDTPKDTVILLPLETKSYTIDTGPMTNINKIQVYIVTHTEDGEEITELVATWTPNSEESSEYLPSY